MTKKQLQRGNCAEITFAKDNNTHAIQCKAYAKYVHVKMLIETVTLLNSFVKI